ncbi:ribosomal RNA large subunit methyltransferase E [Spirochaetia bacterium]|nr:ribosomal RNA large subunit methyltransferase E [Spirochaetia bacterium]
MGKNEYAKPDSWSLKAQKEGYPARSVYKLQEIDEKFHLFRHNFQEGAPLFKALDLGAAPGSWSLWTLRKIKSAGFVTACDLQPLSRTFDKGLFDGGNFFFLQGDMTVPENYAKISGTGPFNLIISDAAPFTSGNRSLDTARSLELAENALHYGETCLRRGGNFCVKIFQGGETAGYIKKLRLMFGTVQTYKPKACRSSSFELYAIGLKKKSG